MTNEYLTLPNNNLTNSTNITSGGPILGLLPVAVILELIDEHHGSAVVANSALVDGRRTIVVKLCRSHELVARSLGNADALIIRFLVGTALVEYCLFWGQTSDGAVVRDALKSLSGFAASDRAWGTQFASRLADCGAMKVVDALPVYSPMGEINSPIWETGPFPLFTFEATLRSPSDIPRWRSRGEKAMPSSRPSEKFGPIEMPEPPEPPIQTHSSPPAPVAAAEPSPRALRRQERAATAAAGLESASPPPVVVGSKPDPFLDKFHRVAKEMLSAGDFTVLEAMAREVGDV